MSKGRPWKRSWSLSSHLSRTASLMWIAFGPSTSSSVLLHQTIESLGILGTNISTSTIRFVKKLRMKLGLSQNKMIIAC
ncbi:hypothetical protein HanPSC8_Chr02g0080551 [Helianthus annuus]|nr:hypothetical protein HanPSC8_Chr02g0080551 [Helianthus annuus]